MIHPGSRLLPERSARNSPPVPTRASRIDSGNSTPETQVLKVREEQAPCLAAASHSRKQSATDAERTATLTTSHTHSSTRRGCEEIELSDIVDNPSPLPSPGGRGGGG